MLAEPLEYVKMTLLERFRSDDRGVAMVLFALAVLPLSMAAGAAVDYTRAAQARSALQSELDSAVLSGAGQESGRADAAKAMLESFATPSGVTITSKSFTENGDRVSGTVQAVVQTAMMRIVNIDTMDVSVSSTAQLQTDVKEGVNEPDKVIKHETTVPGNPVCILVKNATAGQALLINSSVRITAPGCEMHVRSTSNSAATLNNVDSVNMRAVCIKGKASPWNGVKPASFVQNCPAIDDPYAGTLPSVTVANNNCSTKNGQSYDANSSGKNLVLASGDYCNINFNSGFTSITLSGNYKGLNLSGNGTAYTLNPGVYENVNINSGPSVVTFNPGLYIWKGTTNWNSGIRFVGNGVTFYYPDANSYIQINSQAQIDLRAPTSGPYNGILFFEAPNLSSSSFSVNGAVNQHFEGLIYWPSRHVTFNAQSNVTADKVALVVDKLTLNAGMNWKFEPAAGTGMTTPGRTETTYETIPGQKSPDMIAKSVRLVEPEAPSSGSGGGEFGK
ncbi:TadE/TadG family type IV pilus assembly protein [Terrihabitans rhizophilus]|uniref:TadE/TadG family type IV pilus assembly protein n=1 Tax=Terrihabitans rhizophilus TaxID=3092662 RepID=A0ABU4RJK4_9HYPH|nr:TadE/TadG family type IV pilus assembly protein [Terrihabitans sp. PJ23]MDX6805024.1 TadE/TadG family type IV pilus assembly protein [Terrihabitans sp. PJ23]